MATYTLSAPDGKTYSVSGPDGATQEQVQAEVLRQHPTAATPAAKGGGDGPSMNNDQVAQLGKDVLGGLARGAGSIGATLLAPVDAAARALGVNNSFIGRDDRRQAIDQGLTEMGVDTKSKAFATGKIGAEIAGTAGAGPLVGGALKAIPGASAVAPLIDAVSTSGLKAGQATGVTNAAARVAGGAVSGAAQSGLIDPNTAGTGAIVGGALPAAVKVAGGAGHLVGSVLGGKPQTAAQLASVDAARAAGYVIPPAQANPSVVNKILEGLSGKISTAQNASAANAPVTNALAAKAIGLPTGTQITPDLLQAIRKKAGQSYADVADTGTLTPGQSYTDALDKIVAPYEKAAQSFPNAKPSPVVDLVDSLRSDKIDAAGAVAKIKELRSAADDAFRTGNTDIGRASKSAASALESALEDHLTQLGNPQALKDFQDARQLIAKTYSVEKAMNPSTGTIDANKLAQQLAKNKPLDPDLKTAAQFAQAFPKAAQTPERMGSLPQSSPLDWAAAGGLGVAAHSTPVGLIAMGARPVARKVALSSFIQDQLGTQSASPRLTQLKDLLQQGAFRSAPALADDR